MSKSSKSCGYTGHMRIMNRVNQTKEDYNGAQAKHNSNYPEPQIHAKHRPVYPEVAAEQRAQADCSCKLKRN